MLTIAQFVSRFWYLVLAAWLGLVVLLRVLSPSWDEVTRDGDFQYLPADSPSVSGQALLDDWFPQLSTKSHLVAVVGRDQGEPQQIDVYAAYDLSRRWHLMAGVALLSKARLTDNDSDQEIAAKQELAERALEVLNRTLALTQEMYEFEELPGNGELPYFQAEGTDPLALALYNRGLAHRRLGQREAADADQANALDIDPSVESFDNEPAPAKFRDLPINKIWSWQTEGIGPGLMKLQGRAAIARLVVLHLDTEFLAIENTGLFEVAQEQLDAVEAWSQEPAGEGLRLGVSGSAAVGSDLLLASVDSVRNTEWCTLILVTLILILVYRAPLLVLVPLITIGVSLDIALHGLALLTQFEVPGLGALSVFKTTRIFIVVILFGAGTDYCLFLISRVRENLEEGGDHREAVTQGVSQVSSALIASALTTILGLGMMLFASFGKLSNSGPAIGLALSVTLVACLTLTPAMLTACGRALFWAPSFSGISNLVQRGSERSQRFWDRVGNLVVRFPGIILLLSCLVLLIPAIHGQRSSQNVTYDLLAGLDIGRPSRQGTELMERFFPVGESGPVVVLAEVPDVEQAKEREAGLEFIREQATSLAARLEAIPGVQYVRSLQAPLGHRGKPSDPGQQVLRSLPFVQSLFVATPDITEQPWVVRFDVVLESDVFSIESTETLNRILASLEDIDEGSDSVWAKSQFSVAGTTAAIRDLRQVTQADTTKIQALVVAVVFLVLVAIMRHPVVCVYMILSVLASFFVTVGITDWVFSLTYGVNYQGLEWKVPLFLFVILVAVGEDYNVYLASRVFEEQAIHGPIRGLKLAISRTGGIITSCGMIMAGTFVSMTSPVWHHAIPDFLPGLKAWLAPDGGSLQGMIQMGFALSLGVLLDTFIVRPILLPAYLALVVRWQSYLAMRRRIRAAASPTGVPREGSAANRDPG